MWVIQRNVPYEGMYEINGLSKEEVLQYLEDNSNYWDEIYIRPETREYCAYSFFSEFGENA